MDKQRIPRNYTLQNSEETDDGNGGENEKADNEEGEEDHHEITMECDFDLKYMGSDEEQLIILSKKEYKDLFGETNDE